MSAISKVKLMKALATRTNKEMGPSTILRRIAERDRTAIEDCIVTYGNFIWALARKLTPSDKEAEAATEEIFLDIWRYCKSTAHHTGSIEEQLIATIAVRRLIQCSRQTRQTSSDRLHPLNKQGAGRNKISKYV